MPAGKHVISDKWSNVKHLYDDGEYSAIWGGYHNYGSCLGVRWNDRFGAAGYPNYGQYPAWYIEPPQIARMILQDLCGRVVKKPEHGSLENILKALGECS